MKKKIGLLVMAYGTPYSEADIERYYTHIRHGRRPTDAAIENLRERYEAIGGISPLARITELQAEALATFLNEATADMEFSLYLGLKHMEPFIEDAVDQMIADGIEDAISIVLAPHFSTFSVESYNTRATAHAHNKVNIHSVKDWYNQPAFLTYWSQELANALAPLTIEEKNKTAVIVSAHSLPERIIAMKDPYPEQLQETADLIGQLTGAEHVFVGWQSEGNTGEPWIGPDVQDLTRTLHESEQFNHFIYLPLGFVCDHLEVLYDNDVECKAVTDQIGATYTRLAMPNTHPLLIEAMGAAVLQKVIDHVGAHHG